MSEWKIVYRRNLLDHRFYQRWVAGELTRENLRDYAGQYRHVVSALPRWLGAAAAHNPRARARIERHVREERDHIGLWKEFAEALGLPERDLAAAAPNHATGQLLKRGNHLSNQPTGIAVAWALEVQTPAVSRLKLEALGSYYGIEASTGGAYFQLHSTRDVVHATELESVINGFDPVSQYAAQRTADVITDGLWDLLSSVNTAS